MTVMSLAHVERKNERETKVTSRVINRLIII